MPCRPFRDCRPPEAHGLHAQHRVVRNASATVRDPCQLSREGSSSAPSTASTTVGSRPTSRRICWSRESPVSPGCCTGQSLISDERYAAHRSGAFGQIRYLDLSARFRFPDDYFECVYSSHVLEHLHPDVAVRCLREAQRILAPGGIVRVVVPNLDGLVARYDPAEPDTFLYGLYQGRDSTSIRSSERHWWHYNAGSLEALLRQTGFTEIRRCDYREGGMPDVETVDNREGSLFMEAVK